MSGTRTTAACAPTRAQPPRLDRDLAVELDVVRGEDVFFAATGVTESRSGAVREINARHHASKSNLMQLVD